MNSIFPLIKTIEDVLPFIDDNFKVVEKEGLTYINYINQFMPEVFPEFKRQTVCQDMGLQGEIDNHNLKAAIRKECRGIVFSSSGEIISRPFHKFFNHEEREDSVWSFDIPHKVMTKLDGSMIRPLKHSNGVIRLGTKMGVTDVALKAEYFVADKPNYIKFMSKCIDFNSTPIFEYIGPDNRIVLPYEENLVLLAIRDNFTGEYAYNCKEGADLFEIPFVSESSLSFNQVKNLEDGEGVVIEYPDGHRVKVKSDWYVKAHRAKELLSYPRRFVQSLLDNTYDDVYASFLNDDKKRADKIFTHFSERISKVEDNLSRCFKAWKKEHKSKKDFAIFSKDWTSGINKIYRQGAFSLWDNKTSTPKEFIWEILRRNMSSKHKFDNLMKDLEVSFENQ